MFDALYIGATGMQAQQLNVDTIANNLANVNTSGFKKGRVGFSDLVSRDGSRLTSAQSAAEASPQAPALRMGAGVSISSLSKLFDAGDLKKTDSPLDITLQGEGFLEVLMPDGTSAYTRGGTLKVNKDGHLATLTGLALKPGINVPDGIQDLLVSADGRVTVRLPGQTAATEIGKMEVVRFASAQGLVPQGDGLYRSSIASGEAISARPGEEGVGTFAQGYLEGSNVKMVEEMVNLMVAQRTSEANVTVVQAAAEIES